MVEQPFAAMEQVWCLENGPSVLAPELIESYRRARYSVSWLAGEWVRLEVGVRSEVLEAILGMTGCSTTAFVTAANPFGIACDEDDNRRRNEALAQAVAAAGRQFNQNANLWSDERFVPQLLLLR